MKTRRAPGQTLIATLAALGAGLLLSVLLASLPFSVLAESHETNMPTFADGHDKDDPTAGFSAKPATEHTAKANREAAKRLPYHDKISL